MLSHELMNLAAAADMAAEAGAVSIKTLRTIARELRRHSGEAKVLEAGILPDDMRVDFAALPPNVVALAGPRAARDVPPGSPWPFREHRSLAEVDTDGGHGGDAA